MFLQVFGVKTPAQSQRHLRRSCSSLVLLASASLVWNLNQFHKDVDHFKCKYQHSDYHEQNALVSSLRFGSGLVLIQSCLFKDFFFWSANKAQQWDSKKHHRFRVQKGILTPVKHCWATLGERPLTDRLAGRPELFTGICASGHPPSAAGLCEFSQQRDACFLSPGDLPKARHRALSRFMLFYVFLTDT